MTPFGEEGKAIVSGVAHNNVRFNDLRIGGQATMEWTLPSSQGGAWFFFLCTWSYNQRLLLDDGCDGVFNVGPCSFFVLLLNFNLNSSPGHARSICVDLSERIIAVGSSTGHVTLIDTRSGLLLNTWRAHTGAISQLQISSMWIGCSWNWE